MNRFIIGLLLDGSFSAILWVSLGFSVQILSKGFQNLILNGLAHGALFENIFRLSGLSELFYLLFRKAKKGDIFPGSSNVLGKTERSENS